MHKPAQSPQRSLPGAREMVVMMAMVMALNALAIDSMLPALPATYEAMTPEAVDAAARKALSTDDLVYVVVGDAAVVKPQLDGLGLPVETVSPAN